MVAVVYVVILAVSIALKLGNRLKENLHMVMILHMMHIHRAHAIVVEILAEWAVKSIG